MKMIELKLRVKIFNDIIENSNNSNGIVDIIDNSNKSLEMQGTKYSS